MTQGLPAPSEDGRQEPAGDRVRSPSRLLLLLAPVYALGAATALGAAGGLVASRPSAAALAGMFCLLAASVLAEAFPVELESLPAGHVSLAAVFVVGTAIVYGWAPAALIALVTRVALELVQRRPLVRAAYNGSTYAVGGAAAGLAAAAVLPHTAGLTALALASLAAATAFYLVNVVLVAAVIAVWAAQPFAGLLTGSARWTAVPFGIMASVSLMLAVLWERSPVLLAPLAGPLLAIVLHQRSVQRTLAAMRLAFTDALTGLGNDRHFQERLQAELDSADARSQPLTLCLLDVDDFKRINDTYGHPAGDAALVQIAGQLRRGEGYRLGGDEFALLVPATDDAGAALAADAVAARLAAVEVAPGEHASVSIGVATYPDHVTERADLLRAADDALYAAKRGGKGRVRHYRPEPARVHALAS